MEKLPLVTYQVPAKDQLRWLKSLLGFTDTEMANALNISVDTLRSWVKDSQDVAARESVRFHRLLSVAALAAGVIRPERFALWIHEENAALGRLIPARIMTDEAGYEMVLSVLEDLRSGIAA